MKSSILLTAVLIIVAAGLCFGQTARQTPPSGAKATDQTQRKTNTITAQQFKGSKVPLMMDDSMQCIMKHDAELTAAYTEAAGSGCKKVKSGQWTQYQCGYDGEPDCSKCNAAAQKIKAILSGCRLKPPQHTPAPPGELGIPNDVPGCNSLGIQCACLQVPPS